MKKRNSSKLIIFSLFLILSVLIAPNIVSAATSSELNFCDYAGSRRTFQIAGIVLNIAKVAVPLLIIAMGMVGFFKPMISGKLDDIKTSAITLMKQCIAGLVIFLIPSLLDYAFNLIPNYDDSSIVECTNCLFDPDGCVIPDTDPVTYTED